MKFKKILATAAASMVAASVIATSASADFMEVDGMDEGYSIGTGMVMSTVFCNVEADMPMKDYGVDLSKLGYVSFSMEIPDGDDLESKSYFDGAFGGAVGISIHANNISKDDDKEKWDLYNWNSTEYWGLIDTGIPDPNSYDVDGVYMDGMPTYVNTWGEKATFVETLSPYHYRVKAPVVNPIVDGACTVDDITDVRVFLQAWGGGGNPWSFYYVKVTRTVLYDLDNKPILAFDETGKVVDTNDDDAKEPVMPVAPEEEIPPMPFPGKIESPEGSSTPAESTPAESKPAEESTPAESTPAESTATSEPESTPAESTTSTSDDKGGLPVGAIVGIGAGAVAVIGVIIGVVVKKKKG